MLIVVKELNNNSYAWCLRYNICSTWFLDIRIYKLVWVAAGYVQAWQLIITGIETGNETKRNETEVTSTVPHLNATGFSYTA